LLTTLVGIAPLISSIALAIGAGAAWATLFFFQSRTLKMQWAESFRQIYSDFWKDENVAKARRRIDNALEFDALREVIAKSLLDDKIGLDPYEYEILEDLDGFCAILLRAALLGEGKMTSAQREQWTAMFGSYWVNRLYERPELKDYVNRYWPYLFKLTYSPRAHVSLFQGGP
jgi:hypothetical protein